MSSKENRDSIETLCTEELKDIQTRREKADLEQQPADEISRDLCGLALSGGGLRSSSFSLGVVQALHKTGLWRFVDYLSTVSGGGYIGAFLSSTLIQEGKPYDKDQFPLKEGDGHKQSPEIQRLIYGGQYLKHPWLLTNKWLIGVVLINLSLFSGMFCICALIAFLWRCLDYEPIREVAGLLGFGNDLDAPFWPFLAFGVGWFFSWLISFWRRGAESMGIPARFLLYFTVPSLLIGCALLVGNGDIAYISSSLGNGTFSIGKEFWAPLVGLVLGGLFPFLRPKRLLQSGSKSSKPWERAIFMLASISLLIGLPLLIVGFLAHENISGYNDHEYRDVIPQDVDDWSNMLALLIPHENEQFQDYQANMNCFRDSLTRMPYDPDEPFQPTDDQINKILSKDGLNRDRKVVEQVLLRSRVALDNKLSEADKKDLENAIQKREEIEGHSNLDDNQKETLQKWGRKLRRKKVLRSLQTTLKAPSELAERNAKTVTIIMESINPWLQYEFESPIDLSEDPDQEKGKLKEAITEFIEYYSIPREPISDDLAKARKVPSQVLHLNYFLDEHAEILAEKSPWTFLYLRAYESSQLADYIARKQNEIFQDDDFSHYRELQNYLVRIYHIGGWLAWEQENNILQYWKARRRQEKLHSQICLVLNEHVFKDKVYLTEQLKILPVNSKKQASSTDSKNDSKLAGFNSYMSPDVNKEEKGDRKYDEQRESLIKHALIVGPDQFMDHEVHQLNRMLLEENIPGVLRKRSQIRRKVSINEDQITRLKYFFVSLSIFLVSLFIDMNGLSLHNYYRDQIVQGFIRYKSGKKNSISLSELNTTEYGGPYHLITGTVNFPFKKTKQINAHAMHIRDQELNQSDPDIKIKEERSENRGAENLPGNRNDQRWVDSFLFSRRYCGSQLTGYKATEIYEDSVCGENHKIDLADSIALSGAAIAPGHVRNWLISFLMLMFNFRLGQWLPNPRQAVPKNRPRIFVLLRDFFRKPDARQYCFVTDGGLSENLGLIPLLKRRCKLIIAIDASHDPDHTFTDLGKAIRVARIHGGVKIVSLAKDKLGMNTEFLPTPLQLRAIAGSEKGSVVTSHFLFARICYPDGSEGILVYLKPSFDNDEGIDLLDYRSQHSDFPHETSADQFYDDAQVESYRQLGFHIGMQLYQKIAGAVPGNDLWEQKNLKVQNICDWFTQSECLPEDDAETSVLQDAASDEDSRKLTREVLKSSRKLFARPADLQEECFSKMLLELDQDENQNEVVEAIRIAVLDRRWSKEDRLYLIALLVQVELDPDVKTFSEKTLSVFKTIALDPTVDREIKNAVMNAFCTLVTCHESKSVPKKQKRSPKKKSSDET